MKRSARLVALTAAGSLLTAGAIALGTGTASASTVFASCSAQGEFAICDATGTANGPVTITVTVTSSPDQVVFVAWDTTCSQGLSAGGSSGSFTAQTPVTRVISHAYRQPDSCIVSADAQLQAGGNSVHISLSYSQTAPPKPVSHEIKGYAGRCVDDNGNSSAPRTKIQIWRCTNGASQQWSFSRGELKHGSMCMNVKGRGRSGSPVILWSCTGSGNEIWTRNAVGEYVLKASGMCLDDPAYSTANGTQLAVYQCKASANQRWSLP